MRSHQEANDSVSIEQEQADQVRRTVGATLAARALEEVLPAIGKGYAPQAHRKAAQKMSENMNKPKHTPGPWKEHDGFVVGPDFETIADPRCLPPTSENMDTMDANARLIAAAPDMYAALKDVQWYLHTYPLGDPGRLLEVIDAALARARDGA